ncbi:MAG: helix-turn-helix domain-containing protein [Planctomycetota bacterium]|nr:MAG: helix-turn-helix domain-containing protein [Planctomycetota bacterium]
MKQLVTPKQVAQAIGVSESSLKRWCDRGLLRTTRTAGGHRRLALGDVMQFLRQSEQQLIRPELLGLPSTVGQGETIVARAREQLREALIAGDEEQARRIVFDLYLSGQSACDICDRVLAGAFHEIGEGWECGDVLVYRERRGCEIALKTLHDLRAAVSMPPLKAPVALGGALEHDPYRLPTTMVEIALREAGWNATSCGTLLPAATLGDAVRENEPQLLWISVSHLKSEDEFLEQYAALQRVAADRGTAVAVGGRALTEELRQQMIYSTFCDTLRHLVTFVETLNIRPVRG